MESVETEVMGRFVFESELTAAREKGKDASEH